MYDEELVIKGGMAYSTKAVNQERMTPSTTLLATYEIGAGVDMILNPQETLTFGAFYIHLVPFDTDGKSKVTAASSHPFNGTYSVHIQGVVLQYNVMLDTLCKCG